MAKKGLRYVAIGILSEDGKTYTGGKHLSPAAHLTGTPTSANVKDYGDDRVTDTDKSVTGGTLSLELTNDEDEIYSMVLGHKTQTGTGTEKTILYNADDVAPFVGVGAVGLSGKKWVAKFYKKVQFAEPTDEDQTKQENTTFSHVTLEGDILIMEDGSWKERETFGTLEAAKAWVDKKTGVTTEG